MGLFLWVLTALWLGRRPADDFDLVQPQTLHIETYKLIYYRSGEGPPLVLLHGLGASSYSWRYLIPILSRHYEVICLDLLGFGDSDKPEVDYGLDEQTRRLDLALRQLGVEPVAVIGSSLGGILALALARQFPERYPQVVALAPAALGAHLPWRTQWRIPSRWAWLFVNRVTLPYILRGVVGRLAPIHRGSVARYLQPYREVRAAETFWASLTAIADPRLPGLFGDVKVPVLVLWGERDLSVSRHAIARLMAVLPHGELRALKGHAHHPHESGPEQVGQEILTWLARDQKPI